MDRWMDLSFRWMRLNGRDCSWLLSHCSAVWVSIFLGRPRQISEILSLLSKWDGCNDSHNTWLRPASFLVISSHPEHDEPVTGPTPPSLLNQTTSFHSCQRASLLSGGHDDTALLVSFTALSCWREVKFNILGLSSGFLFFIFRFMVHLKPGNTQCPKHVSNHFHLFF